VVFSEGLVRGQPLAAKTVQVTAQTRLEALRAWCDPSQATVQVSRSLDDANRFTLRIIPQQTLPAGSFKFDVTVQPIGPQGEKLPGRTLPVEGRVGEYVQALPPTVLFGGQPIGQTVDATVVLHSVTGQPFEVEGMEGVSEDVRLTPVPQQGGSERAYRVTLRITKPGRQAKTVFFLVRGRDKEVVKVGLDLFGYGVARHGSKGEAGRTEEDK